MKKKWKYVGASLLIAALVAVGLVSALPQLDKTDARHKRPNGCYDQLTEEQREALDQLIQELKDAGATREEIREAIQQFMEEQGIDVEECGMGGPGHMGPNGCYDQLTEEQREALDQLIQELKDAGATHEEIREAIQQFMEEQGITMEDCHGMGGPGHGTQGEGGS